MLSSSSLLLLLLFDFYRLTLMAIGLSILFFAMAIVTQIPNER